MTLTLNLNPKLERPCPKRPSPSGAALRARQVRFMVKKQRLKDEAKQRGVPLEMMVEQELEQLWAEKPLEFSKMLSLGCVEIDFDAATSEELLFKKWGEVL